MGLEDEKGKVFNKLIVIVINAQASYLKAFQQPPLRHYTTSGFLCVVQ